MAIRIISGKLKGRKISVPDVKDLRPTSDRVRTTLFNWLQTSIHGAVCLDCFAGSGVLGFEAYSRGAKKVFALEQNSRAFQNLLKYQAEFGLGQEYKVSNQDALLWLAKTSQRFDLIFLDPPFAAEHLLQNAVNIVTERDLLLPDGLLYIERAKSSLEAQGVVPVKETKAGEVIAGLYSLCLSSQSLVEDKLQC